MKKLGSGLVEDIGEEIEQDEIKGFARSVAEVEWLLLILPLMYLVSTEIGAAERRVFIGALVAFGVFIVVFRFLNFYRRETRLKIAVESLAMVAFTTAVLIPSGGSASPLLNLYLLPIIVAALTLGKWFSLLMVALVSVCYVWVAGDLQQVMTLAGLSALMTKLLPYVLVAFVTTMLANDIHLARSRIKALSETDEMTGLLNMRAFNRIHRREHESAERYGRKYAILMLDMDNLKEINDSYGHEAGNRAIVLVANVVTRLIRSTDVAARYGGDEFIVLLTEIKPEHVAEVARRIRNSIHNTTLDFHGRMIRTSASLGAAVYPQDATDFRDMITFADRQMYAQKELTRSPDEDA